MKNMTQNVPKSKHQKNNVFFPICGKCTTTHIALNRLNTMVQYNELICWHSDRGRAPKEKKNFAIGKRDNKLGEKNCERKENNIPTFTQTHTYTHIVCWNEQHTVSTVHANTSKNQVSFLTSS